MEEPDRLAVAVATVAAFAERARAERVVLVLDRGEGAEAAMVECVPGEGLEVTVGDEPYDVAALPAAPPAPLPELRPPPASALAADPETGELSAPLGAIAHLADAVLALAARVRRADRRHGGLRHARPGASADHRRPGGRAGAAVARRRALRAAGVTRRARANRSAWEHKGMRRRLAPLLAAALLAGGGLAGCGEEDVSRQVDQAKDKANEAAKDVKQRGREGGEEGAQQGREGREGRQEQGRGDREAGAQQGREGREGRQGTAEEATKKARNKAENAADDVKQEAEQVGN